MSFDPTLATSRDHARLLVGDTDVTRELLEDATYDALLAKALANGASAAGAPYCAAAAAGEVILARWKAAGGGVDEKTVSRLSIKRSSFSGDVDFVTYLKELKATCAHLSLSRPRVIKAW